MVRPFTLSKGGKHVFRYWDMSLAGWTHNATRGAVYFGAFFWISILCISTVLFYIKTHNLPN